MFSIVQLAARDIAFILEVFRTFCGALSYWHVLMAEYSVHVQLFMQFHWQQSLDWSCASGNQVTFMRAPNCRAEAVQVDLQSSLSWSAVPAEHHFFSEKLVMFCKSLKKVEVQYSLNSTFRRKVLWVAIKFSKSWSSLTAADNFLKLKCKKCSWKWG